MQKLPKISKRREGFQNGTLSEYEIGLEAERSNTSTDRVCHACARKIRLHNFASSSLQKEKQAAIEVPDDSRRCRQTPREKCS